MRRSVLLVVLVLLIALFPTRAFARAEWKKRIDRMIGSASVGVAVREEGRYLYRHGHRDKRIPASNQRLLLSMALFDRVAPDDRIRTSAALDASGDLWLLGRGDPTVTGGGDFARRLPFEPTRLGLLAREVRDAGVTVVSGSVMGSTGYFARDWGAPGWKPDFDERWCPLPTALAFNGNTVGSTHVSDPEERAARSFTKKLEDLGIRVVDAPGSGAPPAELTTVADVSSPPLTTLLQYTNRKSSNFFAEVLGKRLGVLRRGVPGTTAKGADAIRVYAGRQGVDIAARDSSGLSYENRIAPSGMVRLLGDAEDEEWGATLRNLLPGANEGTLEDRLNGVRIRAKTGSLDGVSALSGWLWLRRLDTWAEISIMSRGFSYTSGKALEDRIVRELTRNGR
jgi:D-alanyl-D-alanine carboxypeptidase/D-alanyl-D-alanine-endopeptidase (penicillin-binding protein 4)